MSILGIAGGLLGGGGLIGIGLAIFAPGLLAKIAGAVMNFVGSVNWAKIWWIFPIAAAIVWGFIQRGEARHWHKVSDGQAAIIRDVKAEVDRGVGKPTRSEDAAFYIRRFVDNVVTLKGIVEREEKGIRQSAADAAAARAGAHQDAQPTAAERDRDKVRRQIADPARTTGLSASEWSQL